ncbi:glycosyltransferase [Corynebacterium glucuronolyticum]|uniref:glycosyltransferase n=1 Tax=Corynebacterium glucuronolyticum TaxID=39791 RepID=UPI00019C2285|nr:glycosyltransferase [Corynebacterium glucuronolyticum]EEI27166.1 glycosyltransferase, group 1 family protein [Corynebacterium glucuronolyticum ATCC 51867]QRO82729.1 glycosyltransferase [Corynebacterium glucuronolyticum]
MVQRKKVLLGGLTQNPGGKEAFIWQAFQALRDTYECHFLVDRPNVAFEKAFIAGGGVFHQIRARGAHPLGYLWDLFRLFKNNRFELVWMHQTSVNAIEPLALALLFNVPKRALHSHSITNMGSRLTEILHHLNRPFLPWIVNYPLACSDAAGEWFYKSGKFTFVPNFFDIEKFSYFKQKRQDFRAAQGIDEQAFVVTHIARFGVAKNHEFTIDILDELRKIIPNVLLVYAGDGPKMEKIKGELENRGLIQNAKFLGLVKDTNPLYSAADVCILPSTFEGLPYVALESQAAQLPIVLSTNVAERAVQTPYAQMLSLDAEAATWAETLIKFAASRKREEGDNPLRGSNFDSALAKDFLAELFSGKAH